MLREHDADQLRRGLEVLPRAQQRVLRAAYWEGLSQTQIARRDQIPLGTVKTRTTAGLNHLRSLLPADPALG